MKTSPVLLMFVVGVSGYAQTPGTFTAGGNMVTPRAGQTATLLPNGKVLIAGGFVDTGSAISVFADAELYDPSTVTFTATGNMTTARFAHTATLLPNDKVLIAGGTTSTCCSFAVSAELYDPSTGMFTAVGNMTSARRGHTATLLNSGKVLITDGWNSADGRALLTAELFDPSTGTFAPTGSLTTRGPHIAALLPDGKVLIVPGDEGADLGAELYDPGAGTFSPTDWRDVYGFVAATVSVLANGKVLVTLNVPGCDFGTQTAELYDSSSGTFSATGDMVYGICRPTGTLLSDGTVLVASGWFTPSGNAQIYDPGSGGFSATGDLIASRHEHTSTLLKDGRVLIAGGYGNVPNLLTSRPPLLAAAELYNPAVLVPAAALLSLSGNGQGQGAILHTGTSQIVSSDNRAVLGEALEIYCTGLADGSVIPPQVAIGGLAAEVLFFGKAPGFTGLNQVNVRVPSGVAPGSAVPVRLTYLGRPSNEVTIAVQ